MMIGLIAAASAASASTPAPATARPTAAVVQARATVRILSGVRIKFDSPASDLPPAHDRQIKTDGKVQPARLIEFE